jgi:hypothetical protein
MFQAHSQTNTETRRGVILMVVLALLTLFAIVGLSFVLYAGSAAKSSQIAREAEFQNQNFPDIDPYLLMSYFLGQLIYDVDDINGISSAMRGHSLARTMYGLNANYSINLATRQISYTLANNTVPFNGTGRLHTSNNTRNNPYGVDDYLLINYTYFQNDSFLRDPERLGHGAAGPIGPLSGFRRTPNEVPGSYVGGFNAPYTYPDLNNMFLAAVKAGPLVDASGKVLAPPGAVLAQSFHRPYAFAGSAGFGSLDPSNHFWTATSQDGWAKYMILRLRPVDMGPGFPLPEDAGGDVKNLVGSPGYYDAASQKLCNNDSIWMDLGFPVMVAPNGKKFKPLFAPLITDLDNRVNLNIHGNIRAQDAQTGRWLHCSNQGWGPWEVSLSQILNADPTEWTHLFAGTAAPLPTQYGRYGYTFNNFANPEPVPHPHSLEPPGNLAFPNFFPPHFYSQIDFDGSKDDWKPSKPMSPPTGVSTPVLLPGAMPPGTPAQQQQFTSFPTYPPGYGNASDDSLERVNHPLLYNIFQPFADDRQFTSSNMEALLRYQETGSQALTSELFRLCPTNFSVDKIRGLVTTRSFDLDRPGVRAWLPNYQPGSYALDLTVSPPRYPQATVDPQKAAIPFPLDQRNDPRNVGGEFLRNDGRAADAILGRIDLNRPLPPYPPPDPTTARIKNSDLRQFQAAQDARVQLAQDIYDRLRLVTTGTMADPKTIGITLKSRPQDFYALQWLAQLAVNIVDYIDDDDYITPFPWNTDDQGNPIYVYGTELPRVVLNEAYAEVRNDPNDRGLNGPVKQATKYVTNFWVELLNTVLPDPGRNDPGVIRLQTPQSQGYPNGYAVYRLKIAKTPNAKIRDASNVVGDPDPGNVVLTVSDFVPAPTQQGITNKDQQINVIQPAPNASIYNGNPGTNQNGFYVMGPSNTTYGIVEGLQAGQANPFPITLAVKEEFANLTTPSSMSYVGPPQQNPTASYGLFLQRLACPALPPTGPGVPVYNPYITVDYIEALPVNNALQYTGSGPNPPANYKLPQARASYGRNQPYAADKSQLKAQQPQPALNNAPQNTFFRHNGKEAAPPVKPGSLFNTISYPFNWLQHGDRPLISPLEILHVSAFKPHELTQQFFAKPSLATLPPAPYQHRAANAILDERSRLYRVFEFLETGDRASGMANGARIPGRININTVWDAETLLALCDPQASNAFTSAQVYNPNKPYDPSTLYGKLIALPPFNSNGKADSSARTPGLPNGKLDSTDRPLLGMAAGLGSPNDPQYPNRGLGMNDTLLRLTGGYPAPALFEVQGPGTPHPSQWDELLNKVVNNLTTRSNVFAVWLTVGFFEVTDDSSRPVKLGAEIGRAESRNKRHRMFAIVDRTNLRVPLSGPPSFTEATPVFIKGTLLDNVPPARGAALPYPNPTRVRVSVDAVSGTYEGVPWRLESGMKVLVDVGLDPNTPPGIGLDPAAPPSPANARLPHQELVTVTDVDPRTFTAQFSYPHPAGVLINLNARPGNPGPQPNYDPQRDTAVVRYLSIIE